MALPRTPTPVRTRAFAPALPAFACLLVGLVARAGPARAEEESPVPPAWVEIARVEWSRGDPKALAPFLGPEVDDAARTRATIALGRIGPRGEGAAMLRAALTAPAAGEEASPRRLPALVAAAFFADPVLVPDLVAVAREKSGASNEERHLALLALGYCKAPAGGDALVAALASESARMRAVAALSIGRLDDETRIEALLPLLEEEDDVVRTSAAWAVWRLGSARRKARSKPDAPWDGDPAIAGRLAARARSTDAEERLLALRGLATWTPKRLAARDAGGAPRVDALLLSAVTDADPQVAGDVVWRIGAGKEGREAISACARALAHPDAIVRETAAAALGAKRGPVALAGLVAMAPTEPDARVREAIAVALAACGDRAGADEVCARVDRVADPLRRAVTDAQVLLADPKDAAGLARALDLGRDAKAHATVRATVLDALSERDDDAGVALARDRLADPDVVVRATAASLLGKRAGAAAVADLRAAYRPDGGRGDADFRQAIVEAAGAVAAKADAPSDARATAVELVKAALSDPAATVRLAARTAGEKIPSLAEAAKAPDEHPNDWHGLPRPKAPILGLDLTQGDPWLSVEEILRLARHVEATSAHLVLETDTGTMRFALDPRWAPVHVANVVLCAAAGVYDGTPWHRVVPAFVIQGGDPRGDGSGDAGYSIPDELGIAPFSEGALGMPKSTKDTGGCQVFVMLMASPHLDAVYTRFGRLVSGRDAVRGTRVGDRIRTARVEGAR